MPYFKSLVAVLAAIAFSSAFAAPVTFTAALSGAVEAPPNASPASGAVTVVFDLALHTMRVTADFTGLIGTTTAAHIHCCTATAQSGNAGVATTTPNFPGFPLSVTSGTYDEIFDMSLASSYNPAFINAQGGMVSAAEQWLYQGMLDGKSYFNVHTSALPGGEIRGFLTEQPSQVPEPSTLALLAFALIAALRVRTTTKGRA